MEGKRIECKKNQMNLMLWFQSCNWVIMRCQSNLTFRWKGKRLLELSNDELVGVVLGFNYAQGFDLNVDLQLVDVDDVAPPSVKLSDAKHHASLLSKFLLDNF